MDPILELSGLSKVYPGGLKALDHVDLTVSRGEIFALLGPNGAGKTTLIGAVCGLVRPSSGTIHAFGYDLASNWRRARSRIGLVPQELSTDMFEPVERAVSYSRGLFGLAPDRERIEEILRSLSLWDKRDVPSRSLSGGMKRRLMIARALVHEPRLLILDEPTAGVDIELRRSMWTFLTELNEKGITIILTTHYLEEAEQLCRNIGIIDHGTIVENTSMRNLLSQLHVETFLLDLKNNLTVVPQLLGYPCRLVDSHTLEVQVDKAMGITALFTQLATQNIEVLSLRNKTNRLEELFVSLVEKNLAKVAV